MSTETATAGSVKSPAKTRRKRGQFWQVWDRLRRRPSAMISMVGLLIIVLIAIFADVIADWDTQVVMQNLGDKLQGPSREHWFGTDAYGRDLFGRIIHGTRTALLMGFGANVITIAVCLLLSTMCAYFGGRVDFVIMRFVDILLSMPPLVLALAICAGLGTGLWQLIVALAVGNIGTITQMFRSSALTISGALYMEAGKALGARTPWMIIRHLIPNMISIILIQFTSFVSINILMGATLSFIGLGVKSPQPEWGLLLSEGLEYFQLYPRLVIVPGIALLLTTLCISTFGDCLRDAFDPKLKGRA